MENVNNDDLSLLSEDFASGAIPSEKAEYLLNGVWVPEKVYLAWLEEQEDPPFSTVRKSLQSLPDMVDLKTGLQYYLNSEGPIFDPNRHPQAYLYKMLTVSPTEKLRGNWNCSGGYTKSEDHTPRSPDNG